MTTFRTLRRSLGVALLLLVPTVAAAETAKEFVTTKHQEIVDQLGKTASKARDESVSNKIHAGFDFEVIAADALGDEQWSKLKDTEKSEFQDLLGKLVKNSYRKSLDQTLGYALEAKDPQPADEGRVKVATVVTKQETKVDKSKKPEKAPTEAKDAKPKQYFIDYTLMGTSGKWKIVDVVIEGGSMVSNYRSQFRKILRQEGYPALVAKMKRRLAKGEK